MNFEEMQEEDCTIYIEELKSDDPNLKINAVQKLQQISEILGSERTREELIPYLVDIIEECDNDEEFLLRLSEELLLLRDKIGGEQFIVKLVEPLEILSSMEEQSIRQKSIENLLKIVSTQPSNFFTSHFLNMVKQLAIWDNFPSRASAAYFLSTCYDRLNEDESKKEVVALFKELSQDDTPMVRRAVADNIGKLAIVVDNHTRKTTLYEVWAQLMKDKIDNVRIKAMENLSTIITDLDKEQVTFILENTLITLDQEKKSWRIRYALAELLPVMAEHLDKTQIKTTLMGIISQLMEDNEQEVKSIILLKLPELVNKLSRGVVKEQIMPLLQVIVGDASLYVRISLANVLVRTGNQFDDQTFQTLIIPLMQKMFKDESVEVKSALITSLKEVNIESKKVQEEIIEVIKEVGEEKNWRVRLALATYLPELCKWTSPQIYQQKIVPLQKSLLMDHYFTIRQVIYSNYLPLSLLYTPQSLSSEITSNVQMQVSTNNYIFRIQGLKGLLTLKDLLEPSVLSECFRKCFSLVRDDKIANVRFNLILTFSGLKHLLSRDLLNEVTSWIEGRLIDDTDQDVKAYGNAALAI